MLGEESPGEGVFDALLEDWVLDWSGELQSVVDLLALERDRE